MSSSKSKLTRQQIEILVGNAFPGYGLSETEDAVKELTEGMCNTAYQVRLNDGRTTILKIAPPVHVEMMSYEKNMMRTEVESLNLVRYQTGVPVPEVLCYDDSHTICDTDYFFMEKIKGYNLFSKMQQMSDLEKEQVYEQIGQYNAMLNEIHGEYYGCPGVNELQGRSMKEAFQKMMEQLLLDGERKQIDIGTDYDKIRRLVENKAGFLDSVQEPRLVHWDLWEGNVFVQDGRVTGIIDFERCMYADPLMEYFFQNKRNSNPGFLRGYGKENFTEIELERRRLYNIYLYLIMTIECTYRHYENHEQYEWAKKMLLDEVYK